MYCIVLNLFITLHRQRETEAPYSAHRSPPAPTSTNEFHNAEQTIMKTNPLVLSLLLLQYPIIAAFTARSRIFLNEDSRIVEMVTDNLSQWLFQLLEVV